MINLIIYFGKYAPKAVFLAISTGVLCGFLNTGLIALVNEGIAKFKDTPPIVPWLFAGACLLLPIFRMASQITLAYLSQQIIYELITKMCGLILASSLRQQEEIGKDKLLTSLTSDVKTISNALANIPFICMNTAIVLSGIVYLFWLFWPAGLAVLCAIIAAIGFYSKILSKAQSSFGQARLEADKLVANFQALIFGAKELKLSRWRRQKMMKEGVSHVAGELRSHSVRGSSWYAGAGSFGQFVLFVVVGCLVFVFPYYLDSITSDVLTGYAMVLLYITLPLDGITQSLPNLGQAMVAKDKIEAMGFSLEQAPEMPSNTTIAREWSSLKYHNICYSYYREKEDRTFEMGPISLCFHPGELVFIIGGNGSGKTTLAKLLLGLYVPNSGGIALNNTPIRDDNRDDFRQLFSVVFSDYYLFDELSQERSSNNDALAADYLEKLQLNKKVTIENGVMSTTSLSTGQRKRLALLAAVLEDRPICLFDEWAADQDPLFKKVFYNVLLPQLKALGKTVIVISHDEHYFHVADRIIKLDYGQIESDESIDQSYSDS